MGISPKIAKNEHMKDFRHLRYQQQRCILKNETYYQQEIIELKLLHEQNLMGLKYDHQQIVSGIKTNQKEIFDMK